MLCGLSPPPQSLFTEFSTFTAPLTSLFAPLFTLYTQVKERRKAMKYFFEYRSAKKFLGRKRTTIITTLNKDIKRTKQKFPSFPVVPLISQVSLQNTYTKAKNRKLWLKIVKQVVDSAYS